MSTGEFRFLFLAGGFSCSFQDSLSNGKPPENQKPVSNIFERNQLAFGILVRCQSSQVNHELWLERIKQTSN